MKKIITLLIIVFCLSATCYASDLMDAYNEFRYVDSQVIAVTVHMYGALGWYPNDKDVIRATSFEAIKDLEEIKDYLRLLDVPEEFKAIKIEYLQFIHSLQNIYDGIEVGREGTSQEAFENLWEVRNVTGYKIVQIMKDVLKDEPDLPDDFNHVDEETKLIRNMEDKKLYLEAFELIQDKKGQEAYEILDNLRPKYQGQPFELCIMLRQTDCFYKLGSNMKGKDSTGEEYIETLMSIVDSNTYSPILYESFHKWRTQYQIYNHGLSNYSDIPNKYYNQKRYRLAQVISEHIKHHPDDLWAKAQLNYLVGLHNILRGGEMGNYVLLDIANLYMDKDDLEQGH
jgi:hypothetical protein